MDGRFGHRLPYDMGITEPTSSSDILSDENLEAALSLLLDDRELEETTQTSIQRPAEGNLSHFFLQDRQNYFTRVASTIKESRENFSQIYRGIDKNIELMTHKIILAARKREMELKAQLREVGGAKLSKWEQQLFVCGQAAVMLQKYEAGCSPLRNFGDSFWNEEIFHQLEFVDAGQIKLNTENYSELLKNLQSFGKIICSTDDDSYPHSSIHKSFRPKFVIGGNESGQFCRPWGVCSDATGRILVCDRSNHKIKIFSECGEFLLEFGREGSRQGEFNRPSGIAVDVKCRIVVCDKDNHRIQVFTYSGHFLLEFGSRGTRPGEFMYPWDVDTNEYCQIAVSDSKNHRVQLFNENGHFLNLFDARKMGIENPRLALKFLDSPRGVAFTPEGKLLVTDFNNHRVLLINESFTNMTTFGCEGKHSGKFFRPQGIACCKNGRIAVADCKNYRIQVFDAQKKVIAVFGSKGSDPGQFDCPQGICFHPNHNIIVVDFNNNRVQAF